MDYRYHNDYLIYLSMNPITNCPRLKYISAARHILDNRFERRRSFRLYFDICLRFSSNITDLYLPCFNLLELDPVAIVFLLHNFSSLKNLLLGHGTRIAGNFAITVIAFFFIHKHCRNMESFRFKAQHSFPITDDEELPTTISTITNNNIMQTINTRDQNNQQSSRLKYLDLHLNSLQSAYTTLICNNYFPIDGHQLQSFILTLCAQTIQRFFLRNNIDTLLLFANSLATCPIVEISATGRGGWNTLARQRNTLVEVQIAYNNCRRFLNELVSLKSSVEYHGPQAINPPANNIFKILDIEGEKLIIYHDVENIDARTLFNN